MANNRRHLVHVRTNMLQYVKITKSDVPVGATVTQVSSVPTPDSLVGVANPSEYIQVTTNNWYYRLTGKQPENILKYGEIAVSYSSGHERLYIQNESGSIVEFRPYEADKSVMYAYTAVNEVLTVSGDECTWYIPYTDLTETGISPSLSTVVLRDLTTGAQVVPDVVFDNSSSVIKITIYSKTNIASGRYRVIVSGLRYSE